MPIQSRRHRNPIHPVPSKHVFAAGTRLATAENRFDGRDLPRLLALQTRQRDVVVLRQGRLERGWVAVDSPESMSEDTRPAGTPCPVHVPVNDDELSSDNCIAASVHRTTSGDLVVHRGGTHWHLNDTHATGDPSAIWVRRKRTGAVTSGILIAYRGTGDLPMVGRFDPASSEPFTVKPQSDRADARVAAGAYIALLHRARSHLEADLVYRNRAGALIIAARNGSVAVIDAEPGSDPFVVPGQPSIIFFSRSRTGMPCQAIEDDNDWIVSDLLPRNSQRKARGPVTAIVSSAGSAEQVVYAARNHHVILATSAGNGKPWRTTDLTATASLPRAYGPIFSHQDDRQAPSSSRLTYRRLPHTIVDTPLDNYGAPVEVATRAIGAAVWEQVREGVHSVSERLELAEESIAWATARFEDPVHINLEQDRFSDRTAWGTSLECGFAVGVDAARQTRKKSSTTRTVDPGAFAHAVEKKQASIARALESERKRRSNNRRSGKPTGTQDPPTDDTVKILGLVCSV